MGMNLHCMLYLQSKGLLSAEKNKLLDIGPQNVYFAKESEIRQFLSSQGVHDVSPDLADKVRKIEYFCTPRPDERTTMFSDITELTNMEYAGFDVCPAPYTDIVDLNFDALEVKHRSHYDVVLNFGTTEHIFNQWNSFEVMHEALKVGGVLYCVLPMSAYLDHGYYCYTPLFFKDLAKSNDYELIDLFIAPAGLNNVKEEGLDVRHERKLTEPNSAVVADGDARLPQYNIHAVMRKTVDAPFRATLEVATAHSDVSEDAAARCATGKTAASAAAARLHLDGDAISVIAKLEDQNEAMAQASQELRSENERLWLQVRALEAELNNIRTSTTWTLTAPLRAAGDLAKRK